MLLKRSQPLEGQEDVLQEVPLQDQHLLEGLHQFLPEGLLQDRFLGQFLHLEDVQRLHLQEEQGDLPALQDPQHEGQGQEEHQREHQDLRQLHHLQLRQDLDLSGEFVLAIMAGVPIVQK